MGPSCQARQSARESKALWVWLSRGLAATLASGAIVAAGCERRPVAGEALPVTVVFGEGGDSPGQFAYPRAIDADETSVWVIDKLARVQRLDATTGESLGGWRMPQWQLGKPTGVTVWVPGGESSDEFVFVPDTHYHRVCVYRVPREGRADGAELVAQFGEYGTGPGQFVYTTDVAVIPNAAGTGVQRLYVSEYGGNDRVSVYERANPETSGAGGEYAFVTSFGKYGIAGEDDANGELVFNRPQSIEWDSSRGELIVNDSCNHRVGRVTLDGKLVAWYGCSPSSVRGREVALRGQPRLLYPYGLELPGDGTALIAEFGGVRLHRVDLATGQSIGTYGKAGRKDGELLTPWGVALANGAVFVLDSGNNRVQAFALPRAAKVASGFILDPGPTSLGGPRGDGVGGVGTGQRPVPRGDEGGAR
jgi:NHL repeat